jgi:hypothetical protein
MKIAKCPLGHADAVRLAAEWLKRPASRNGPGCQVVVTEAKIGYTNTEMPDAIGFRTGVHNDASVLVECKVTRADFLADFQKPHRIAAETGMGLYRYYLAPAGMIDLRELPNKWGLIEVTRRGALKVVHGHVLLAHNEEDFFQHEHNQNNEWALLARTLYRVGDVDAVNRRLRESHNRAERLARQVEDLTKKLKQIDAAYYLLHSNAQEDIQFRATALRSGRQIIPTSGLS